MSLRRAPEKYIAGALAPAGPALDRAGLHAKQAVSLNARLWRLKTMDANTNLKLRS
jgi:hypothetical protein